MYGAYRRRELDRVASCVHADIDWIIFGPVTIFPFAGQRRGRAAVLAAMAAINEKYSLESYEMESVVVEDERAAIMSDVSFRQRATGRILRFRVADFLRFQDGLLIEFREFANMFDVVEQALGQFIDLPGTASA